MSLTDPDARNRRIGSYLLPFAWVLALLGLASGPVEFAISTGLRHPTDYIGIFFLIYLGSTVGFGLMLYYTAPHRNPLGIAAYTVAYVAGLILVLGTASETVADQVGTIRIAFFIYVPAAILLVVYIMHAVAAEQTLKVGVTTTATVTSAGINGMVNYVSHWRLTLKFTDQDGKDRWFHIGRTGLGYSVGDTFQIKYNPQHPARTRGIVVLDG